MWQQWRKIVAQDRTDRKIDECMNKYAYSEIIQLVYGSHKWGFKTWAICEYAASAFINTG